MKRIVSLIVIGIALIFLFAKVDFFSQGKQLSGSALSRLNDSLPTSTSNLLREIDELKQENASLRTQIFNQKIFKPGTVEVYSSYPLNSKKDIAVAAGSLDGVREGSAVTWGDEVLIGKVVSVFEHTSVVSTIFDPSWEMAARIGQNQINTLFKGGNIPKATLIPREGGAKIGDSVIATSKNFPYGLEVGKIKDLSDTAGTPFCEATLETEIQLSDLRYVTIHN